MLLLIINTVYASVLLNAAQAFFAAVHLVAIGQKAAAGRDPAQLLHGLFCAEPQRGGREKNTVFQPQSA
jgi:hypothetical protein